MAVNRILPLLAFLLTCVSLFAQTSYSGFIGKYPIELVTDIYSDGDARAIYAYSHYDEPIVINGRLEQGILTLNETDSMGEIKATLTFQNVDKESNRLEGVWKDLTDDRQLPIRLTKNFDIDDDENTEWTGREIIQPVSLRNHYFKLVVSKEKDSFSPRVTGVKILEKKTDKLLQELDVSCRLWGLANISIGDYNFDDFDDFSVFEQSYAGPNTSSLYFLYDATTHRYFDSGFSGISLEFDSETKTIYEQNQSGAGSSVTTAAYKVVDNKMVLVTQSCFKWDPEREELVEQPLEDCQ